MLKHIEEERPDLNGLLRKEMRNKVCLSDYQQIKEPKTSKLEISSQVYENLKTFCKQNNFTVTLYPK